MIKYLLILFCFISNFTYAQSEKQKFDSILYNSNNGILFGNYLFTNGIRFTFFDSKESSTNGVLFSIIGYIKPYANDFGPRINGINSSILLASSSKTNGVSISPLVSRANNCNGIMIGCISGSTKNFNGVIAGIIYARSYDINGLSISGAFTESNRKFNGVSISAGLSRFTCVNGIVLSGLSNFAILNPTNEIKGHINGLAISLLYNKIDNLYGVGISCIANNILYVNGLSVSLVNITEILHGIQIGVINVSRETHGFQLGIINITKENRPIFRVLPLINL